MAANESESKPITGLIADLAAIHVSSILVGRIPPVSHSAEAAVASEHARELAQNPKYFARSASNQKLISLSELEELLRCGATERDSVQKIRVFAPEIATTFSVPCAHCERWIWCGREPASGRCRCGHQFEIAFDGTTDWELPQGRLCMDCGEPFGSVEGDRDRGPWQPVGARQVTCQICAVMNVGAWWVEKRRRERPESGR